MKTPLAIVMLLVLAVGAFTMGAKMDKTAIHRLGDAGAGEIQSDRHGKEINDPTPIVLWTGDQAAAVLYYNHQTDLKGDKVKYTQRIVKLAVPGDKAGGGLKKVFDAYPITFSASLSDKEDERAMEDIKAESIRVADLNGDGTDELVVPRNFGTIDVYSTHKHLYGFKPASVQPKRYDYLIEDIHRYTLKQGDGLLYVINRDPVEDIAHFDAKALEEHRAGANFILVRLDKGGASSVMLQTPQGRIEEITAVGARNLPGSDQLDELVVCSKVEDSEDIYISRHRPDGAIIGEPRKAYAPLADGTGFRFIPHCSQMLMFSPAEVQLYFISPDKKANWLRHLDLRKLAGAERDVQLLGTWRPEGRLIALVRHQEKVYALDEESHFYVRQQGVLTPRKEAAPLFTITAESPRHKLVDVIAPDNPEGELLAVQSLEPRAGGVDDAQLEEAARSFLAPEDFRACEDKQHLEFNQDVIENAGIYCDEHGKTCPPMASLDDVKKQLPEFYAALKEDARQDFLICLRVQLLSPLNNADYALDEIDDDDRFINKSKFRAWLEKAFSSGELVLKRYGLSGKAGQAIRFNGFSSLSQPSELELDTIQARCGETHATAVAALRKSGFKAPEELGYFLIKW